MFASLSSSKNGWAQASIGLSLLDGVYSNNLLHRLMAPGGVLGLKT